MVMIPFWSMGRTMSQVTSTSVEEMPTASTLVGGLAGAVIYRNN
jgi:hypothetical protein